MTNDSQGMISVKYPNFKNWDSSVSFELKELCISNFVHKLSVSVLAVYEKFTPKGARIGSRYTLKYWNPLYISGMDEAMALPIWY